MSPKGAGHFQIARSGDAVYVRVVGLGSMQNAVTFKELTDTMVGEGFRRFVVDLQEGRGLDSTFMGCLLGLASTCREKGEEDGVLIINADAHCKKQLESTGLLSFVRFKEGHTRLPSELELRILEEKPVPAIERLKLIMKAHKDLIKIDQRNEEKFGPFLKGLLKEMGDTGA